MNKIEFATLADAIRTYYPHANIMPNEEAMSLWYEELKELPFDVALASVRYHVNTTSRIVTIHDIKYNLANTGESWESGFEKVLRAVSRYGMYNESDALASFDDVTRTAVNSVGWRELCCSENPDIVRAQFRMAYENIKQHKENTTIIESITSGIAPTLNKASELIANTDGNKPERKSISWESTESRESN